MRTFVAVAMAASVAWTLSAAPVQEAGRKTPEAGEAGARVAALGWLTGTWEGTLFGKRAEETWSRAQDGVMTGMFRLGSDTERPLYEFLLIEEDAAGVTMRLRHYGPGMRDLDAAPLSWRVSAVGDRSVTFHNPEREQVHTIRYALDGSEGLRVELISGGEAPSTERSRFTRVAP